MQNAVLEKGRAMQAFTLHMAVAGQTGMAGFWEHVGKREGDGQRVKEEEEEEVRWGSNAERAQGTWH